MRKIGQKTLTGLQEVEIPGLLTEDRYAFVWHLDGVSMLDGCLAQAAGTVGVRRAGEYGEFHGLFPGCWLYCGLGGPALIAGIRQRFPRLRRCQHLARGLMLEMR